MLVPADAELGWTRVRARAVCDAVGDVTRDIPVRLRVSPTDDGWPIIATISLAASRRQREIVLGRYDFEPGFGITLEEQSEGISNLLHHNFEEWLATVGDARWRKDMQHAGWVFEGDWWEYTRHGP